MGGVPGPLCQPAVLELVGRTGLPALGFLGRWGALLLALPPRGRPARQLLCSACVRGSACCLGSVTTQLGVMGCVVLFKCPGAATCSSVCVPRAPSQAGGAQGGRDPRLPRADVRREELLGKTPPPRRTPPKALSVSDCAFSPPLTAYLWNRFGNVFSCWVG